MISTLGKVVSVLIVTGLGFGIHSCLSYIELYTLHAQEIALAVYFLTLGATFLASFFGIPEQMKKLEEEIENANQ